LKRIISPLIFLSLVCVAGAGLAAAQCDPTAPLNNFCLTGVGNGANLDGIYVSPYTATVNGVVGTSVICDDFYNDVNVGESWSVTPLSGENVSTAATTGLFGSQSANPLILNQTYTNALLGYEQVAYLSQELIQLVQNPSSLNPTQLAMQQDLLSYSIWAVFDPTDVSALLTPYNGNPGSNMGVSWNTVQAELASLPSANQLAADNASGAFSNVTIYTPTVPGTQTCPSCGAAQEFVAVRTPEAPALANLTVDFLGLGVLLFAFGRRKLAAR